MSTHTSHPEIYETWFCTITCYRWLNLIDQADAYGGVYKWFSVLKDNNCHILGYVIMPNHLHCLLYPTNQNKNLDYLVSNGKRFMAYDIIQRLQAMNKINILSQLAQGVQANERKKGKKHQIFRLSYDGRLCFSEEMLEQKLRYIHHNPVKGKWHLVEDYSDYEHSSAAYYEKGQKNVWVTHYKYLN